MGPTSSFVDTLFCSPCGPVLCLYGLWVIECPSLVPMTGSDALPASLGVASPAVLFPDHSLQAKGLLLWLGLVKRLLSLVGLPASLGVASPTVLFPDHPLQAKGLLLRLGLVRRLLSLVGLGWGLWDLFLPWAFREAIFLSCHRWCVARSQAQCLCQLPMSRILAFVCILLFGFVSPSC